MKTKKHYIAPWNELKTNIKIVSSVILLVIYSLKSI